MPRFGSTGRWRHWRNSTSPHQSSSSGRGVCRLLRPDDSPLYQLRKEAGGPAEIGLSAGRGFTVDLVVADEQGVLRADAIVAHDRQQHPRLGLPALTLLFQWMRTQLERS